MRPGSSSSRSLAGRPCSLSPTSATAGHPYAQFAAGFGIGTTTAYRYTTETIDLLASLAPTLAEVTRAASTKAYVLLDGTLLPIDGIAADQPF